MRCFKKNFFCIILIIFLLASLCSCGEPWQLSDPYFIEESDVFLEVDNSNHTKDNPPILKSGARLILSNHSDCDIEVDMDYLIKLEGKKGWIDIEGNSENRTVESVIIKSNEDYKMTIDWSDIYGILEKPGTYRIIFFYIKDGEQYLAGCNFGFSK